MLSSFVHKWRDLPLDLGEFFWYDGELWLVTLEVWISPSFQMVEARMVECEA